MTIRHLVMFRWSDDVPPDHAERAAAALATLPAAIPAIESYEFGADAGLVEGNMDFAVVAGFADEAAFFEYRDHPDHQRFIAEFITGKVAARVATQLRLP